MILGHHAFAGQVHMTGIARAAGPLVFVGMTAKTVGHGGKQCMGFFLYIEMAAHAVALVAAQMLFMRETQVFSGKPGALPR